MNNEARIRALPDLLINKIAAGEVVERPASVVKELVDNALDAGARRIAVAMEDGGKQLIQVIDDGGGMSAEELRLAVMPHTTSKIMVEDDLYAIATLGFRGEALASISAVSKLRIASRLHGAVEGHEVRVAGKQFESAKAAGCPAGTTVEVRDLFFNVPARRKFLRARSTEVGHVNEQIARAALAFPQVGFELTNNGRVSQNLPPSANRLERVAKFYGAELAAALIPILRQERGITLEAYAAPPAQSRANANWQYTYVNGRYIRDRYVQHALREAYRGLMEPSRYGVVFLFLTLDPAEVDVNVHPTKIEVRWAESNLIHSQVLSALRETFQRSDLTPALNTDKARPMMDPVEQDRIRREMAAALKASVPIHPPGGTRVIDSFIGPGSGRGVGESPGAGRIPAQPSRLWESLYAPLQPPATLQSEDASSSPSTSADPAASRPIAPHEADAGPRRRAIQLHNVYLVAETENGIVIVDQHALHERVIFEQLRERIRRGPLESQRLLLPESLTVTAQEAALLESNAELLHKLGLEVTRFGTDAVAVHAFPSLLKDTDVVSFMRDLVDDLGRQAAAREPDVVVKNLLEMMACKAAVKAGDPLTEAEIESLLRHRHRVENSSSCPHGRPTSLHLTRADLDRQFKRT